VSLITIYDPWTWPSEIRRRPSRKPEPPAYYQRGRLFCQMSRQETVRGHVWITGTTVHYEVLVNGVRVLYDNTGIGAWHDMVLLATAGADAVHHLLMCGNGNTIKEYKG